MWSLYHCFQGEIYNHLKLRSLVDLHTGRYNWSGTSDTESLIVSISVFGLNTTLLKLDGMWAFCLLDLKLKKLYLSRDIFGEKPLYWGFMGPKSDPIFSFSSDLSVFRDSHLFRKSISKAAFSLYAQLGYVPDPYTIYSDFFKLKPGHLLSLLPFSPGDKPLIHQVSDLPTSAYSSLDKHIDPHAVLDIVDSTLIILLFLDFSQMSLCGVSFWGDRLLIGSSDCG